MPIKDIDIVDLGLKHEQNGKSVKYLKIINHNSEDNNRILYLLGIEEDQIRKWLQSLET